METAPENLTEEIHIHLYQASTEDDHLEQLKSLCREYPGDTDLIFALICASGEIAFLKPEGLTVRNCLELRHAVMDLFGEECLRQKPRQDLPQPRKRRQFRSQSAAA